MDKGVDDYISKLVSPQKEICQQLRKIIFHTLPDIKEEMRWGVPTYGGGRYYLVSLKTHVNLGFSLKGLSKKETALLKGSGKTMRHIEITSLREMDEKMIVRLLKVVKGDG